MRRTNIRCDNELFKQLNLPIPQHVKELKLAEDSGEILKVFNDESELKSDQDIILTENEEENTSKKNNRLVYDFCQEVTEKELEEEPKPLYLWIHMSCAHWIPEIKFGNPITKTPIDNFSEIDKRRFKMVCSICMQKGKGCCTQCARKQCTASFHVECARLAGLAMETGSAQMGKEVSSLHRIRIVYTAISIGLSRLRNCSSNRMLSILLKLMHSARQSKNASRKWRPVGRRRSAREEACSQKRRRSS